MSLSDITLLLLRAVLVILLYAFLGTVVVFLWQDLRRAAGVARYPHASGRLVVVEAGEDGPEPSTVFSLQEVTSLGRLPSNTIVFSSSFVSAYHALLAWREGRWWLEDQGSKNGTTLNGEFVTQPTIVGVGDLVGVGRVVLRLEME